jgi:hypothetical protein
MRASRFVNTLCSVDYRCQSPLWNGVCGGGKGKGERNDQGLITSLDVGKGILNNRALEAV